MKEVLGYDKFTKIELVDKGWSEDNKYYIETIDGEKLLLRLTDISKYNDKKLEYEMMQEVAKLNINMSMPIAFGTCNEDKNVYILITWSEGEDAEIALSKLTDREKYEIGMKSGEYLKKIHSIKAPDNIEDWADRFNRKATFKINKYKECGLAFEGGEKVIEYINDNRYLLENRPQTYQHGDYHVGNMIISENKEIYIIDFNRPDFGDPWEEFNRIVWSATASPHFATGQLRGYFHGEPPLEFFKLLLLYISSNMLSSIYWSIPFGQKDVDVMMKQSQDVLKWYDNMKNPIPTWYLKDYKI